MIPTKKWSDLDPKEQRAIVAVGTAQVGLLVAALIDLWRRPAAKVRGSKRLWAPALFVNFIGPISYFAFGRKR
jgi:hypothetical protein